MTLGVFRDYSPGLNRFLSRDMYNGALDDLDLGINPFTANRYAFGAGNPVSNVELDGHWLLGKLVKRITKTVRAVVSDSYKRQDRTLDGVKFQVRGYLSKNCIQDLQCPFEEYRAQALAIRWANLQEGMFTDAPSENVDWEVRRKGCSRKEHCGRGDILRSLFDTDIMIAEVKRYRGQSTTDDVNAQLRGYERELRGYGLSVRRDPSFRNANGSGVIGAFVDDDGRTNVLENAQVFIDHPLREQGEDAPWCICILS